MLILTQRNLLEFTVHEPLLQSNTKRHRHTSFMKTSHINRSCGAAWLALVCGLTCLPDHAHAATLFQDTFSGSSLDSSKWTQNNTNAWAPSSLQVANGAATFNFRPIITTTQSFSGSIQITGSFSLGNAAQNESLLFVTRSTGSTAGNSKEPAGLRFRFNNSGVDLEFMTGGNYTSIVGQQSFALNNNQMYSFSIVDAGNQASVSINGSTVLSASLDPNLGGGQGKFSIANRERAAGTQVGPITVSEFSVVPEPSALGLLVLGAGSLAARRRRK